MLLTYVSRVQYSCGIVLVFWFWWDIVFGISVSFLVVAGNSVVAGNRFQNENTF